MSILSKRLLSGSDGGRQIKVTATNNPGTLIHTTPNSASVLDEIWIYVANPSDDQVLLTLGFGGTTNPDDLIEFIIAEHTGRIPVIDGQLLSGSGSAGRSVTAIASIADQLNISGFVNRIS